jgi:hypothetical protein
MDPAVGAASFCEIKMQCKNAAPDTAAVSEVTMDEVRYPLETSLPVAPDATMNSTVAPVPVTFVVVA